MRVLNPSLWISNRPNLGTVNSGHTIDVGSVVLILLGLVLVIIAEVGYSFYLWYLKSSHDQEQRRLLDILYGYLSLIGMAGGVSGFTMVVGDQTQVFGINIRVVVTQVSALSLTFLVIAFATVLRHFKPTLYLEISLRWRNKVAIPILVIIALFIENMLRLSCSGSEDANQCTANKMRIIMTIPATLTSFICQLVVVVDDLWGWNNMSLTVFRRFSHMCCRPNLVTPENGQETTNNTTNNSHQFVVHIALQLTFNKKDFYLFLGIYLP